MRTMIRRRTKPTDVAIRHWCAQLLAENVAMYRNATYSGPIWMSDRQLARTFRLKRRWVRDALATLPWDGPGFVQYARVGPFRMRKLKMRRMYSVLIEAGRDGRFNGDGRRPPDNRPPRGTR